LELRAIQRAVAREFGLSRETVRKMLAYAVPPGYQRQQPIKRPKLGPWLGVIDAILAGDKQRPAKQRHTAKRIFDRLRDEHGFTGGYTIVKDYVPGEQVRGREMFVPLTHAPGEAQADFGEALVVIAGVQQKAHYLVVDLPHSDDRFVAAFPAETTEAFLDGHVRAFAYFGGVPTRILYDNTKIAVAKILGGEEQQRISRF
jgi:transposase